MEAEVRFGARRWSCYRSGNVPLILTVPHGGSLKPSSLPDRSSRRLPPEQRVRVVTGGDGMTLELANDVTRVLEAHGLRPHVITCHLHRSKVDQNRPILDACMGHAEAERAYKDYHGFIADAIDSVSLSSGPVLLIDIHGHAVRQGLVQLGYLLSGPRLRQGDYWLGETSLMALSDTFGSEMATELVCGPASLGHLITERWRDFVRDPLLGDLAVVPSPDLPAPPAPPGSYRYFSGGNTVRHWHGSRVAAVQIESSPDLRSNGPRRDAYVAVLGTAIEEYLRRYVRFSNVNCFSRRMSALNAPGNIKERQFEKAKGRNKGKRR